MKKKLNWKLIALVLSGTAMAAKAVDPLDFDPAYDAAASQMGAVAVGAMALVGIGAAISYGIKIWKRMKAAV